MASAGDKTTLMTVGDTALLERLFARGWEFDFFEAVWLLERYGSVRVPVGDRGPVSDESFRFRPDVSLGFPPTDVRRITHWTDAASDSSFYQFEVTFMGLYGVSTPLPLHYAVDLLRSVEQYEASASDTAGPDSPGARRMEGRDATSTPVRDFLDILHHRLISLFYRGWLKYRYDRAFGLLSRDVITDYLLWLIGCPRSYDEAALGVSPVRLLRYAGILTQHPRSATTLEGMLRDYWGEAPIEVQQCVGRWVPVSPADRNCIGVANSGLGLDLTVGEQVYDLNGAFNVTIGPTDWATYLSFLPGEPCHAQTRALVALYCADPLSVTIELRLQAEEVPQLRLSSDDGAGRLGFTSWARTEEIPETSVTFDASSCVCAA
ncbi:MAG: type VI secretion system baseplate subunit TssG [Phycisphaerae bacterium]